MMSQKEFQRVKVIENAAGATAETPRSARFLELGAAWQSRTRHGLGCFCSQKRLILTLARVKYQGSNDSHRADRG